MHYGEYVHLLEETSLHYSTDAQLALVSPTGVYAYKERRNRATKLSHMYLSRNDPCEGVTFTV